MFYAFEESYRSRGEKSGNMVVFQREEREEESEGVERTDERGTTVCVVVRAIIIAKGNVMLFPQEIYPSTARTPSPSRARTIINH